MKTLNKITLTLFIFAYSLSGFAQVSVSQDGQDPHPAAVLDLISNDKGLLIPRIETTDNRNNNIPVDENSESLLIYNKETQCIDVKFHHVVYGETLL